ncbi:MAG TPA: glycosyltransferase [Vicinamibacterales bacterium]
MRILWAKMGGLWPATSGGRVRSLQIASDLARRHSVTVLTTHGPGDDPDGLARELSHCHRVISIPYAVAKRGDTEFAAAVARSWLSSYPVDLWKWRVPSLRSEVRNLIDRGAVDLCISDFLFAAVNVPMQGPVPVVLFEHNVEYLIWQRLCAVESRRWRRALIEIEWRKLRAREADACARADLTVAVSEDDRRRLEALAPGIRAVTVPTGVDTNYFTTNGHRERAAHLVFSGSMDWHPNEDAVMHFADVVLPRIRAQVPDASFTIVGRNPSPRVRELAQRAGIVVTGTVDDVRPWIGEAAVYVVPVRAGSGTRLKIFEALAMGKAVVSTTVGAEGLGLEPARHFLCADDPAAFADAVISLLRDADRRRALGQAGRSLVELNYSWPIVAGVFEKHCEAVVARSQTPVMPRLKGQTSRAVLICHERSILDREALASWLASRMTLAGLIIIRDGHGRLWRAARRELRRVGLLRFLDVAAFRIYARLRLAKHDAAWEQRTVREFRRRYPVNLDSIPRIVVTSPNGADARSFLAQLRPDLIIARCKVILKPAILQMPRAGTFVLHPGICPEYRNAHGCFWALARRDLDRVGMTLLRADAGVDTGPVYLQAGCDFDEVRESHVVIQHRVVFENLDAIESVLRSVCRGDDVPTIPTDGRHSATWGQPRLTEYLRWKRAARRTGKFQDADHIPAFS